jgi:alpha-ketoglutarate-dependent taurine dioxygenase
MSKDDQANFIKTNLEIQPVAGRIGAEVKGIRLSEHLNASEIHAIRQALLKYKVLFFREQHHLDDDSQEAFARLLGDPVSHPTVPVKEGTKYLLELNSNDGGGRADAWHTDVTFVDAYPQASILRAVIIPETGGDTVWANTATAYQNLPEELRDLADRLWALHTNEYDYAAYHKGVSSADDHYYNELFTSTIYETEHPVVRVHPETGERILVLGQFAKKILGLSLEDSTHLISVLQGHITQLENTVRWRWAVGDVVIWDNRATQHYAINDYGDQERVVRRVTLAGDVPVSIDGRRSVTRKKVKVIPDTV